MQSRVPARGSQPAALRVEAQRGGTPAQDAPSPTAAAAAAEAPRRHVRAPTGGPPNKPRLRPGPGRTEPFSDPLSPSSASSSGSRRSGRGLSSSSSCCAKGAAIFPSGGGGVWRHAGSGRGGVLSRRGLERAWSGCGRCLGGGVA